MRAVQGQHIGKDTSEDIAVRCPICGDSKHKKRSARLHLYNKGTDTDFVSCFNGDCPVHNKNMYSFLRDFFPTLLDQYKRETFKSTLSKLSQGSDDVFKQFKNLKKEVSQDASEVVVHDLTSFLKPLEDEPRGMQYLQDRGLPYSECQKYCDFYFGYQDLKIGDILYPITNSIVIPLMYHGTMYGFYSRSIETKSFYTYNPAQNVGYKIFNWFNVNKNEPCYIYEGIFDMIAGGYKNSIALLGAKLPEARLEELAHPIFVLDNDKTGMMNSLVYARRGFDVYVQPPQLKEKDMNELKVNTDLNIPEIISQNLCTGIIAEIKIKSKL